MKYEAALFPRVENKTRITFFHTKKRHVSQDNNRDMF